jgi:ferritin-like metal-binding protein YciE
MASDIKDLLQMELQDTYSAETQILEALPKMQQAATTQSLKQAFGTHLQQTRQQVERLKQACQMLGIDPEGETCEAMEGLVEEGEQIMDEIDQGPVLDAALIAAAQKVEHYEIAAYGTLCTMLKAMGETRAAELLHQTLEEEKQTDELLTGLAEREVNPAAMGRTAANDPSGKNRGAA